MDSQLRPRDIQMRIRAGESAEEVAQAAGVPVERIDAFAAPVLAERSHLVGVAQAAPVRRRGEMASSRVLRTVVSERLLGQGVDADDVSWDAWKRSDGKWVVQAAFEAVGEQRAAHFVYDLGARFSVADNDDARWLIEDRVPAPAPEPAHQRHVDPDSEPTVDLDDELALVRATLPESDSGAFGSGEVPDYLPAELAEVDGVYDLVAPSSEMDVLYEMISGIDEDSVRIYTELSVPVSFDEPEQLSLIDAAAELEEEAHDPHESGLDDAVPMVVEETAAAAPAPAETGYAPPPPADEQPDLGEAADAPVAEPTAPDPDEPQPPARPPRRTSGTRRRAQPVPPVADQAPAEQPEQNPPAPTGEAKPVKPAPKRSRSKRASVPSWDEIMFGSKE